MRSRFLSLPPVVGSYHFLQPPPCLQCFLPRVGNNIIRLVTRESHKRCMHLLQHKLQVLYSSLLVRRGRLELTIDELCRGFSRLFSRPLQHHLRLMDHTSKERLRFFAREFLRTTKAIHIDETRRVLPNLSCRKIVDCPYCF